ncbi:hypothetical protein LCGC14_1546130 [marine sediment metagenome]|uniref:Uncharacterized protein n=1 Tax=marine sediment metagenome TaxID=412755 RepID=A0A0F9LSG5_9ZZZZ
MVFSGDWGTFNKWQKEGGKGKCLVLVNAEEKENEAEEGRKDKLFLDQFPSWRRKSFRKVKMEC